MPFSVPNEHYFAHMYGTIRLRKICVYFKFHKITSILTYAFVGNFNSFIPCLIIKIISEIENFLLSEAKDLIRSVHSMLQVRKITSILTSSFWRLRPQTPAFVDNLQDLYDV